MSGPHPYDTVIVGSGFGGAVAACRLAQAGQRVLVLERGRRWTPETFPRGDNDPWLWNQKQPQRFSGWADVRTFSDIWVIAGAGVGGGSLIYANVSVEAPPRTFAWGWPDDIGHATLQPWYDTVGEMLAVAPVPDAQLSPRARLVEEAAHACGWGDRFRKLPLAVSFRDDWHPDLPGAREDHQSRPFQNAHGRWQGTCVHCGNCDVGCQVLAKNTLDLNYLAVAEDHGAEIRPLHLVQRLEPLADGWRVRFDQIDPVAQSRTPGEVTAARVIVAAGSIGSTELLLRCRDTHRTLPRLSARLGYGWAHNGDFVTPAFYPGRMVSPSHGVTISAVIDLLDGSAPNGQALFVEDGGIPNIARNYIRRQMRRTRRGRLRALWREIGGLVDDGDPLETMMPWFGQGVDPGDGQLRLCRKWYAPWRQTLEMSWRHEPSEAVIESMIAAHRLLSAATGGNPWVPPTWRLLRNLVTPHPLGGCNMGRSAEDGVVDSHGRVFGYTGLYVMDGAIVPRALGLNPSRTIAALAERNVALLLREA
ncbi:GMC oxidoreductase [Cupriavidus sp. H18C2]|uniref:GMC oxidoreductase n=1 Tax=Cupriavidus sp. H18C2 TaxID=3241602 RepID=UPI003BF838DD